MNARTLARLTFANPVSALYLTAVGGSVVVATAVTLFAPDPGFIWVWPAFFTMPASGLVALAGIALEPALGTSGTFAFYLTGIVLSALVQSLALGLCQEAVRSRLRGRFRLRRG